jgi:hypothetical protein
VETCFHDSGDSAQPFVIHSGDVVEASLVKLLQPKLTPDPNLRSSSVDRHDVAQLKTIARTEYADTITIQNR